MSRPNHSRWILVALAAAGTLLLALMGTGRPGLDRRVYRIGFENAPPFHFPDADGKPAGLVVEIVAEAAHRRGIQLQWQFEPGSSEAALRQRKVDLWPLMTITPERKGVVYITAPYREGETCLIVRKDQQYRRLEHFRDALIAYSGIPIERTMLQAHLPQARLKIIESQRALLESVCHGGADAAFIDEYTAITSLLDGISCGAQQLRVVQIPEMATQLGVGSTLEASAAAEAIRAEISTMALQGRLADIYARWGQFSGRRLETSENLAYAQRKERWLIAGIAAAVLLLLLALWQTARIRRQRNVISRAESAVRLAEQKLRLLANSLRDMVLAYDMSGNLIYANAAVERLTGYGAGDLKRGHLAVWVHPEDRERMQALWDGLFRGRAYANQEYRLVDTKGSMKWTSASGGPMLDEDGRQIGVQATESDITDRKRVADALVEQRTFADIVIDSVPGVFYVRDRAGRLIRWNHRLEQALGVTADQLMGSESLFAIHEEDRPYVAAKMREAFESGEASAEARVRTAGGHIRTFLLTARRMDLSGKEFLVGTGIDITESKQAEAALAASEERYRSLVENANDIVYTVDLAGRFTSLNKAGETITGYSREEAVRLDLSSVIVPEQLDRVEDNIRRRQAGEDVGPYEVDIMTKDGRRLTLEINSRVLVREGRPVGLEGIARDVTERKHLEERLLQAQKMDAIGRLAGGVAHDFNNLLTAILGFAELGLEEIPPGSPLRDTFTEIQDAAEQAAALTAQLLAFARRQKMESRVLDLNALIAGTRNLLQRLIGEHIELVAESSEEPARVKADLVQLQQVIVNLAVNSRDAMPRGGKLTIRTATMDSGQLAEVAGMTFAPGAYVVLSVSDTGHGMDKETRSRVFEPFFTTKPMGRGTGLGLATVYGIVEQTGGRIWIESEPGRGTTVNVCLPCSQEEPMAPLPPGSVGLQKGRGTILLVEDEDHVRKLAGAALQKTGYRVLEARDGVTALRLAEEEAGSIDLLLTDLVMPQMTGAELAECLAGRFPALRVVFMSGYTDRDLLNSVKLISKAGFLQKPFTPSILTASVRAALEETEPPELSHTQVNSA